jgi:hypothetical protein
MERWGCNTTGRVRIINHFTYIKKRKRKKTLKIRAPSSSNKVVGKMNMKARRIKKSQQRV